MPTVAITRTYPGELNVGAAKLVVGPHEGLQKPGALAAFVKKHRPDVLISMYHDRIDGEMLDAAGPQLKGVVNFAVGFNNIDLAECAKRKITVCNTPDAVTEGTADLAMLLILAAARMLIPADRYARSPEYPARGFLAMDDFLGVHLTGQTLLIVGAGRIGYATAVRTLPWHMRVLYVARSRHLDFEIAPLAAQRVELEEGLRDAEVISIHTPLTPDTRHLINEARLRLLKPNAIVVNTARGPIIDEGALARALKERRLFAAGLDVYENEPTVHPELLGLDNVVLTPHIGSAEEKYRRIMTGMVGDNARAILEGRTPPNLLRA